MMRTNALGTLLAVGVLAAGCAAEPAPEPALQEQDLDGVDTAVGQAIDQLEAAQGVQVDDAQRVQAIQSLHDLLGQVPSSDVAGSSEALTPEDLGDVPAGDVSQVSGGAGSTSGSFGVSGAGSGSFGSTGGGSGSFGTSSSTGGSVTGPDGARADGFGSFALACGSYGVVTALDLDSPTFVDDLLNGFDCVAAGTAPQLRWGNLSGPGPFQVWTIALDFQTVQQLGSNPESASTFLLRRVWGPITTSATSLTYGGPYLSNAGGFGILVGIVANDSGTAGLFIALIL